MASFFRNRSVHEFYCLKALITLEQVITSVVEKKNNLAEQNLLAVVNFHCMQMGLVMSMRFIFGETNRGKR